MALYKLIYLLTYLLTYESSQKTIWINGHCPLATAFNPQNNTLKIADEAQTYEIIFFTWKKKLL